MYDAAHAAWIGGTKLLQYGELLPGGAAKALAVLAAGARPARGDATGATAGLGQLVLELGMGRGRLALQLFLSGATVIGVELASERYGLAVAAMERLAHRSPEDFEIVHRGAQSVRLRRCGGPKSALYEVRLGSFFDVVTDEEIGVATLVFLHVSLPPPTWSRVRGLVARTRAGCRLLAYEDLAAMWERQPDAPPLTAARGVQLACSWAPEEGHRFLLCERVPEPPGGPASSAHEAPAPVAEGSPGGPPWPAEAARSGAAAPPAPVPTAKALSALSAKAAAKRLGRVG
ncbi:unnamed protein product [Prorocentrum cordatum]|uniref:Uncharacterized protein n=1 Tax=Prorocentrum cordatum TaxID=2364126 RepID=A0ABN9T8W8_9DINO|nr:unnamed protein product [Polarella glacialis]